MDIKRILGDNVRKLMVRHLGEESTTGFARFVSTAHGTVQRITEMETSVGVDIVADIARGCKLEPWQLLVPDLDPAAPPELARDQTRIAELLEVTRRSTEGLLTALHGGPDELHDAGHASQRLTELALAIAKRFDAIKDPVVRQQKFAALVHVLEHDLTKAAPGSHLDTF